MTQGPCDPCCNPAASSNSNSTYQFSVVTLLCNLIAAVEAGGATPLLETTPVAGVAIAFGSVPAAFGTLIDPAGDGRVLEIRNQTNQQIVTSLDGVTVFGYIEAGGVRVYDFATNGLKFSNPIEFKYDTAAPTTGQVLAIILK